MDALPTSGVWQSYRKMPVISNYEVRGVDKWFGRHVSLDKLHIIIVRYNIFRLTVNATLQIYYIY